MRAVVFDLFGTLTVDQTPAERHKLQAPAAAALGLPLDGFLRVLRETFTERSTGTWGTVGESLRAVARILGAEPSDAAVAAAAAIRLEVEVTLARPRPGVVDLLTSLQAAGVPVGVLSDCTWELVGAWPNLPYGELVDAAVFSVDTGIRKPDPAMYAEIARRLAVAPETVLYVGDGGSHELTGARAAGMRPVLLRESLDEPAGTSELRYDAEVGWTGEHVHDMAELRALLVASGVLPRTAAPA